MVELKSSGCGLKVKKNQNSSKTVVKFLCSYGGMILPRSSDGQLRYVGGVIRILSVDRSVSFAELLVKLGELCGSSVILRCQLPSEDLDALISVTSDEDLANIIEEYDRASQVTATATASASSSSLKIRAFLSPPKSLKKISPPPSLYGSPTAASRSRNKYSSQPGAGGGMSPSAANHHQISTTTPTPTPTPMMGYPIGGFEKSPSTGAMFKQYAYISQGSPTPMYLLHNGNYWQ